MAHRSDADLIQNERGTARFCIENRQIAWVLLFGTIVGGIYGYTHMPKRKDPNIPVRVAAVITQWPGGTAMQVEQLVTRPLEQSIATNQYIHPPTGGDYGIKSLSLPGLSIINVQLIDTLKDTKREFNDMNLKLNAVQLPQGAGPVNFNSDFGDTAALMLTVASPLEDRTAIAVRAQGIRRAIEKERAARRERAKGNQLTIVYCFPQSVQPELVQRNFRLVIDFAVKKGYLRGAEYLAGPGFVGVDSFSERDDATILALGRSFVQQALHESEIHPDAWGPVIVRDPAQTEERLAANPGSKYTYHQLEEFTDLLGRTIQGANEVSRVDRNGILNEQVYLDYSQERLASYGLQPSNLRDILNARNITAPGGVLDVSSNKNLIIDPSGQFNTAEEIGESRLWGLRVLGRPCTCGIWWIFQSATRARRAI